MAADARATFEELQKLYGFDEKIVGKLVDAGLTSLSEFRFFCKDEEDVVTTFVTPLGLENERLQGAKLKRAWNAVVTAEKARETSQVEGVALEEDECLPASSLTNMKELFWKRYHWLPPPEQQPSDKLLSKVKRSLEKRNVEVLNMFQVKSLTTQRQGVVKRRKVAPKIWVGEDPADAESPSEDVWTYLDNLFIYLVALAMAGAQPINPQPAAAESPSSNSCDYVEFPLDLAWKSVQASSAADTPRAGSLASALRDGTPLCEAWNQGQCPNQKNRSLANAQGTLEEFQSHVNSLMDEWSKGCVTDDNGPELPVFLDMLSGPKYPLARALEWAGWKVVQPHDILISPEFDLTSGTVQTAVAKILPECHAVSAAMDCSTKSRIREIALPGHSVPQPLRSAQFPRGLPTLSPRDVERIRKDNSCSDFLLAVQHVMQLKSRAAFRENPRRSLHWNDPNEVWMMQTGGWYDFLYDNCCFLAARKKAQTIRHNVDELRALPNLICSHWHNEDDWRPFLVNGQRTYPSSEEAEYLASLVFTIAVCLSHWAANRGFGVRRIPRFPPVECSGDRREWTQWDPETFREHSMVPMAVMIGLCPPGVRGLPQRIHITDGTSDGQLEPDVIYAGHGHFTHRLSPTKWENPFVEGRDGGSEEVLLKFIAHWAQSGLASCLHELTGKKIACDCPSNASCHVDVLIAKWLEAKLEPEARSIAARTVSLSGRQVWLAAVRVVHAVPQMFSQHAAMAVIKGQFPSLTFHGVKWPLLEDIMNTWPFQSFRSWLHESGQVADGPIGAHMLNRSGVAVFRAGMAEQAGAGARKTAAAPVVPFNLSPEEHFAAALHVQGVGCPLDFPSPVDLDIHFAAQGMVQGFGTLTEDRNFAMQLFVVLGERLQGVTEYIRSMQQPELRAVNPDVHLSLIALLVAMIHWPDTGFCQALPGGFPAVGFCPPCGIWDSQPARFIDLEKVLDNGPTDGNALLRQLQVREFEVIKEAGMKDQQNCWCSEEFGWRYLVENFPKYRLIRRFVITQASGKKRVIDDAAGGGQSLFSEDANKLQFCSALQPCAHVQALAQACFATGALGLLDAVVTCGEDLPDA
eukprot:s1798_g8.t1